MFRMAAVAVLLLCLSAEAAAADVTAVFPSGSVVPENLLRISIQFDRAPAGDPLDYLALRLANGEILQHAFYPQPLWSPNGRRLTVLLDPARVKLGLAANRRFGRPLHRGECVDLLLQGMAIKHWCVTAEDDISPTPAHWDRGCIVPGTEQPLLVKLAEPIDVQSKDLIAVADPQGRRVGGVSELVDHETLWRFTPDQPWGKGFYQLVVNGALEDAAGNSVMQTFEYRKPLSGIEDRRDIRLPLISRNPASPTP